MITFIKNQNQLWKGSCDMTVWCDMRAALLVTPSPLITKISVILQHLTSFSFCLFSLSRSPLNVIPSYHQVESRREADGLQVWGTAAALWQIKLILLWQKSGCHIWRPHPHTAALQERRLLCGFSCYKKLALSSLPLVKLIINGRQKQHLGLFNLDRIF